MNRSDPFFTVHQGDARRLDVLLSKFSSAQDPQLTCTITSPPYGPMKNYGHPDQIGYGQSYDDYLVEMRRLFRQVHRHTKDEGAMWVVADTFRPQESNGQLWKLQPLPFDLAAEAEDAGWLLRDVITWHKDKTLPWSGRGRLRNVFEYVLFLVKSDSFKYHVDRIRDPIELEQWWVKWPERYNPEGKVPGNVWRVPIPVQGSWNTAAVKHACPLPPDLVERMILLSTDQNDVVFDPFAGTGVVVAEAERLARRGLGIELVRKHVRAFQEVVRPEIQKRDREDELGHRAERSEWLQRTVLNLRIVKYPKVLMQGVNKPDILRPRAAVVLAAGRRPKVTRNPYQLAEVTTIIVADGDVNERDALALELKDVANRAPASKFGVAGDIVVVHPEELAKRVGSRKLYLYLNGRTHMTEGPTTPTKLLARSESARRHAPIAANLRVLEEPRALQA
jgi:DNA modification methylase